MNADLLSGAVKVFFGLVMLSIFCMIIYILMKQEIPPANKDILFMLFGSVATKLNDVYGYYFNTSEGSEKKNRLIAHLTKQSNTPKVDVSVANINNGDS